MPPPLGNLNPGSVSTASDESELPLNCDLNHQNALDVERESDLAPRTVSEEVASVVNNNQSKMHVDESDAHLELAKVEVHLGEFSAPTKTDLESEKHVGSEVTSQKIE